MRSDYTLYVVAAIFFVLTCTVVAYAAIEYDATYQVWIVTTVVLGLAFIGLGYSQRPKTSATTLSTQTAISSSPSTQIAAVTPAQTSIAPKPITQEPLPTVSETSPKPEEIQTPQPTVEVQTPTAVLMGVKGIGPKRMEQLKALGITSLEELAGASDKDLAEKLKISPKITGKWIENAKTILNRP